GQWARVVHELRMRKSKRVAAFQAHDSVSRQGEPGLQLVRHRREDLNLGGCDAQDDRRIHEQARSRASARTGARGSRRAARNRRTRRPRSGAIRRLGKERTLHRLLEDLPMATRERPLSPHLQVYKWQITMTMSILHRVSGMILVAGALGLASPVGQLALFGFSLALVYHLLNGIRHLLWDAGFGFEIPEFYATGWTVAVLTVVLTAAIWFFAMGARA